MAPPKTEREEQVFRFIERCLDDNGQAPTVREIALALGLSSPANIHRYLKNLQRAQRIAWNPNLPRSIRIVDA